MKFIYIILFIGGVSLKLLALNKNKQMEETKTEKLTGFVNLYDCRLSLIDRLKNPMSFLKGPVYKHCVAEVQVDIDDDLKKHKRNDEDQKMHVVAPRFKVLSIKGVETEEELNFTNGLHVRNHYPMYFDEYNQRSCTNTLCAGSEYDFSDVHDEFANCMMEYTRPKIYLTKEDALHHKR